MSAVLPTPIPPKPIKVVKRRKAMKRASPKRQEEERAYWIARRFMLKRYPNCAFTACMNPSVAVHHCAGRSGNNYLDVTTWRMLCREHHRFIHDNPRWARERGWLTNLTNHPKDSRSIGI